MATYPLSHSQISPGPDYTKMQAGTRPDGLADGRHTGGVWLSPDETEVYKPLDCLPYPNAERRQDTQEAACLQAMVGQPGFPRNWRIETQNGRRWIVRSKCYLWPQDRDMLVSPNLDAFLMVESAIFALNAAGWEYNDLPQLAYDPNIHEWFLLDCSAAFKPETWSHGWHGDRCKVDKWLGLMGLGKVLSLRKRGFHVHHATQLPAFNDSSEEPYNVLDAFYPLEEYDRRQHEYIYASLNRPLSASWFKVDGTRILRADAAQSPRVHSWAACTRELDRGTLERFELTMAYKPWP